MAESRTDRAYAVLKTRIVDGEYAPGHRLVIDQLTRESGISAIPWREALRRLEAEGWVEFIPHAGARVRTFETDSWEKTVRLVARLEGYATSLAVGRVTEQDLAAVRQLNDGMAEALARFDPHRFGMLDRQFHELVCGHGDDAHLEELLQVEWARLELARRGAFWFAPGRAEAAVGEHAALIDLLATGADLEEVEAVARQHKLNTLAAVHAHEAAMAAEEAAAS